MLLRQDFDADLNFPDSLQFPTTSIYSDDAIDDCLMSGQPFQFHDPPWTLNVPLFESQQTPNQQVFASHPNNNSFDFQQQSASQQPGQWQLYGDGNFNINQALLSPQSRVRQHRRALSNSTATSQASTSSPLQYPAVYDGSHLEAYSPQAYQNYPTPSQTPTQDSFVDRRNRIVADLAAKGQRGSLTSDPGLINMSNMSNQTFDFPATPKTANGDFNDRQVKAGANVTRQIPGLGRTVSEAYQDELYNPMVTSIPQQHPQQHQHHQMMNQHTMLSPHHSVINDRLQAAYEARSSQSPMGIKREASPFRPESPYAMNHPGFGQIASGPIGTAAGQRQQQKAEADARAFQQHHMLPDDSAPKTISPQEAYLDDFHDPAEDSSIPLFRQSAAPQQQLFDASANRSGYGALNLNGQVSNPNLSFQATSMPSVLPKRSPSSADFVQNRSSGESNDDEPADFPAHLISMETSKSEPDPESSQDSDIERPASTTADSGSYTCTYQNCTQRFASPALLQKHKRDAHRPMGVSGPKLVDQRSQRSSSATEASLSPPRNSQAGPHRCDRINPSTGKPCNTVFSRPYDLTRHEDTIHARRGKVQCQYCTEEKTFSRADALTRHMRVVHPTIDFPGKHRRRAGD